MIATARLKYLGVSAQKTRLVVDLIRGKKVDEAITILNYSEKAVGRELLKLVKSAVANAENNHGLDGSELVVAEAWVGKNLLMKRFHARGRGRSGPTRTRRAARACC